jgi:hypothetical protein
MAKAKDTPDYEAIGKAVVLLASLFNSGAAVAAPSPSTTSTSASNAAESSGAAASTPEAPKDEPAGVEGNSQGMSKDDFSKFGMAFAKECGDQGAKLKAIWANYKQADGSDVKKLSDVQEKDYDAFIAAIEEARLA